MAKQKTTKKEFEVKSGSVPEDGAEKLTNDVYRSLVDIKQTGSTVPSYKPTRPDEQTYFYKNGSTYRIYFYINNEWKYVALT